MRHCVEAHTLKRLRADCYSAYNFFRLVGILQCIVGRVRDGTAANANAAQNAAAVRALAERGWDFAIRAGATG